MKSIITCWCGLLSLAVYCQSPAVFTLNEDGYLLLEAENLAHSELWQEVSVPDNNNVGAHAYLQYDGPVHGSGHEQEIDPDGSLQGDEQDWLLVPVRVDLPGRYRINLKNHHLHKDGDNDIWVHIKGWPGPVRRVGDHGVDTYQWLTWGMDWVYFDIDKPGVYEFYVAGRSRGFGIDRIAIYREQAPISLFLRETPAVN